MTTLTSTELKQGSAGFLLRLKFNLRGFSDSYLAQTWRVKIVTPDGTIISKTTGLEFLSNTPYISIPIVDFDLILSGTYYYQVTLITGGASAHSDVEKFFISPSLPEGLPYSIISSAFNYFPIFTSGGALAQSALYLNSDSDLAFTGGANFTGQIKLATEAYGGAWANKLEAPTKKAIYDLIGSTPFGEVNTASNVGLVGSLGIGVFHAKAGVDLQLRKLNSTTNRLGIALNVNQIDFTVNEANLAILSSQVSGDFAQSRITNLIADLGNKQNLNTNLTAISGLTPSNDDILQRKAGVWANRTPAQFKTDLVLVKGDVGLGNVDNVSDALKPISSFTQAALDLKAGLAGAAFTGPVNVPDSVYAAGWDGDTSVPTKNAVYDKIQSLTGITDGDKGDITVTSSGSVWTIDSSVITLAKMANLPSNTMLGNNTGSSVAPLALTTSQVKTLLAISNTDVSGLGTAATLNTGTSSGNIPILGAGGLLANAVLPPLAITSVSVVATQAAQLALTAEEGDVAIRSDQNKSYVKNAGVAGTMADWNELLTPTDSVLSVNGYTGVVSLVKADVGLSNVQNVDQTNASNLTSGTVAPARLGTGSGTAVKFLREDSTWQTVSSGMTVGTTAVTSGGVNRVLYEDGSQLLAASTGLTFANNILTVNLAPISTPSTSSLLIGSTPNAGFTGSDNTVLGRGAGAGAMTGYGNTLFGSAVGAGITSGQQNTIIGFLAGNAVNTNNYTILIGAQAGYVVTGDHAVFIGYHAGIANTTGGQNIFIGSEAGPTNISGSDNTYVGYHAGFFALGSGNTYFGKNAGFSNSTGAQNVNIGYEAGYSALGNGNVFLGSQAGYSETGSNKFYLGNVYNDHLIYGEFDTHIIRVNGRVGARSTTEQGRLEYDASNYFKTTVNSTGSTTFDLTGTTPTFTFNKAVSATNFNGVILTAAGLSTKYLSEAGTYTVPAGGSITINSTVITGGTSGKVLYDNAGTVGEYVISGTGNVAMTTNPVFTTPNIGTATGSVSGNAGSVTNATLTTALTVNTGTVSLIGNAANTSALTIGAGSVSVSGSNTGDQTTITGNAGTATALQTARAIYGNNFDGTAALAQIIASTYGGTGNGFTKFSGPTTSEKTKTLRDATDTILELGGSYTPTGTWTSLTLVTPVLGTPASGVMTNVTGTATGLTAGNATTLQTARLIGGISFNGSTDITVATATGGFTISGGNLALGANSITMSGSIGLTGTRVTKGWFTDLEVTNNALSNNFLSGYATTATAAGTTTLTVNSARMQNFTGSTTQTVVLPVVSTLALGHTFEITNNSSGNVTVQSSGANNIQIMGANSRLIVVSNATTGTTAAVWNSTYISTVSTGTTIINDVFWAAKGDLAVGTANDTAAVLTVSATNDSILMVDSSVNPTGLKWGTPSIVKTALGLNLVENTALSTWAGTTNITTLGTISSGTWSATAIGETKGGTGQSSYALGDTLYSNATNTLAKLAGNITTTKKFLNQTGNGSVSAAPSWNAIVASDIGSGAALTKTDDTNITLTLGGSPSTALLTAASLTLGWAGQLSTARGGTGLSTYVTGDLLYASASNVLSALAGNATATKKFLSETSSVPSWGTLVAADVGLGNVTNFDQTNASNITSGTLSTARLGTIVNNTVLYANGSGVLSSSANLGWNGSILSITGNVSVTDDPYDKTTWDGSVNVATKNAIRDRLVTLHNYYVIEDYASLTSALAAIAATGTTDAELRIGSTVAVTADTIIPSYVYISFNGKGIFNISAGVTLTIKALIDPGDRKLYTGSGKMVITRQPEVQIVWWTGKMPDADPQYVDITSVMWDGIVTSGYGGMTLIFSEGRWRTSTKLTLIKKSWNGAAWVDTGAVASGIKMIGQSAYPDPTANVETSTNYYGTIIQQTTNSTPVLEIPSDMRGLVLQGICFYTTRSYSGGACVDIAGTNIYNLTIERCAFYGGDYGLRAKNTSGNGNLIINLVVNDSFFNYSKIACFKSETSNTSYTFKNCTFNPDVQAGSTPVDSMCAWLDYSGATKFISCTFNGFNINERAVHTLITGLNASTGVVTATAHGIAVGQLEAVTIRNSQVETNTVVGTITTAGNARIVITHNSLAELVGETFNSASITVDFSVAVSDTATQVATKARTALNANGYVTQVFSVGGTGAVITLTLIGGSQPSLNDANWNFSIDNAPTLGSIGLTAAPTSTATAATTSNLPTGYTDKTVMYFDPIDANSGYLYPNTYLVGDTSARIKFTGAGSNNVLRTNIPRRFGAGSEAAGIFTVPLTAIKVTNTLYQLSLDNCQDEGFQNSLIVDTTYQSTRQIYISNCLFQANVQLNSECYIVSTATAYVNKSFRDKIGMANPAIIESTGDSVHSGFSDGGRTSHSILRLDSFVASSRFNTEFTNFAGNIFRGNSIMSLANGYAGTTPVLDIARNDLGPVTALLARMGTRSALVTASEYYYDFSRLNGTVTVPATVGYLEIKPFQNDIYGGVFVKGHLAWYGREYNGLHTALGNSGAITIDCSIGSRFSANLSGDATFIFSNVAPGQRVSLQIDATTTNRTVTWGSGVYANGGRFFRTGTIAGYYMFEFLGSSGGTLLQLGFPTLSTNANTFPQPSQEWSTNTSTTVQLFVGDKREANSTSLTTFTLPTSANAVFGDTVGMKGTNTGGFKVAQNTSQLIKWSQGTTVGTDVTTTGTGGFIQSVDGLASIILMYIGNNTWSPISTFGAFTLT